MKRNVKIWGMLGGLLSLTLLASSGWAQGVEAGRGGGNGRGDDGRGDDGKGGKKIEKREDIRRLPQPLKRRIIELALRPHTYEPQIAFSEADGQSLLVQYFLLDSTQFQPSIFTTIIPGINDGTRPTAANAPNRRLPTIGSVRVVVEPKPGFPTDPNDPKALIDMFTDVSGLFVINNESGWYEGWVIRDIKVPPVGPPRANGRAQYGSMTAADHAANAAKGTGNNAITGNFATTDGNEVRFFSPQDVFPDIQANIIPIPVSLGTFNALQQSDVHAYWEFNPGTNWIFPHYELPFTGGTPGSFVNRMLGGITSIVPGSGPNGTGPRPFQSTSTATILSFTAMTRIIRAIPTAPKSAT